MDKYVSNLSIVLQRLQECDYHPDLFSAYRKVYDEIQSLCAAEHIDYAPDQRAYIELLFEKPPRMRSAVLKSALDKLDDVYLFGEVKEEHLNYRFHRKLGDQLNTELEMFLETVKTDYSPAHMVNEKERCRAFLFWLQEQGKNSIRELTFQDLAAYHAENEHKSYASQSMYEACVKSFLQFHGKKGNCNPHLFLFFHYLQRDRIIYVSNLAKEQQAQLEKACQDPVSFLISDIWRFRDLLLAKLHKDGYSETIINTSEVAVNLLFLFVAVNSLKYTRYVGELFLELSKEKVKSIFPTVKRSVCLLNDYLKTGQIDFNVMYRPGTKGLYLLPEWCSDVILKFLDQRRTEKKGDSTISMDESATVKFCQYITARGITSFSQLDAAIVKQFNLDDKHSTAKGKNAYNSRIRRFLRYLARNGYTENYGLYLALINTSAPSESIVTVLTEEEKQAITDYADNANSEIQLRDTAVILLATELGIRGVDIADLKYSDIDWKNRTILTKQRKTKVQIQVPMPVNVGNALYRYIKNGRHESPEKEYIFVNANAPFRKMNQGSCQQALDRVLPDRHISKSGFHVTRRTFSTAKLQDNFSPEKITHLVGHTTGDNINKYLSLDDANMNKCPLSFENLGLSETEVDFS